MTVGRIKSALAWSAELKRNGFTWFGTPQYQLSVLLCRDRRGFKVR